MLKNFDEVPHTMEALRFYIHAAERQMKEWKLKIKRSEELIAVAKDRLKNYEDLLIVECVEHAEQLYDT